VWGRLTHKILDRKKYRSISQLANGGKEIFFSSVWGRLTHKILDRKKYRSISQLANGGKEMLSHLVGLDIFHGLKHGV